MKKIFLLLSILLSAALLAQEADFRVMSFNMERGDLGEKKGRGWSARKEGALMMLETRKPDLLGVQECNSIQRDDILNRLPYKYVGVAVNGEPDDYPKTSANLIFYNDSVELLEDGQFWFSFEPESADMYTWIAQKPRSATWARFRHKATGREFYYINNNLQNGVDAVINRAMSLTQLLWEMRRINRDNLPMLYTGDLNSKGIEGYYAPLKQEMKESVDACPITDRDITHGGYKRKTGSGGQIDHIFFSGALEGLRFGVDRDTYAGVEHISDHFPVYADLRFTDTVPEKTEYWFDLKPAEGDCTVKAGTWNLWNTAERDKQDGPSWNSSKENVARIVGGLGVDIMAFQELTEPMVRDLQKLLKNSCGKQFKLWCAYSDPSFDNPLREAVGLLYDASRFSVSNQRQSWIRAGDTDAPASAWGEAPCSFLSAVFKDKVTGTRFFVMAGKFCKGETPIQNEGRVLKEIEKELNPEKLPCLLLIDMNTAPKNQVFLSVLNYWTDTYTLMYPFPDRKFSTRVSKMDYVGNTPRDWAIKYDLVAISRHVENKIVVSEHTVHREELLSCSPVPSNHYPVTATLVFTGTSPR